MWCVVRVRQHFAGPVRRPLDATLPSRRSAHAPRRRRPSPPRTRLAQHGLPGPFARPLGPRAAAEAELGPAPCCWARGTASSPGGRRGRAATGAAGALRARCGGGRGWRCGSAVGDSLGHGRGGLSGRHERLSRIPLLRPRPCPPRPESRRFLLCLGSRARPRGIRGRRHWSRRPALNYVTDMAACLELITVLERTPITREVLESTRLGKHINDIRRKTTNQDLYRRAKDLVRKWRKDVLADGVNGAAGSGPGPGGTGSGGMGGRGAGNGHPPTSPSSLPSSGNTSPGMSAPTTPSTLSQRTRPGSPTLTTAQTTRPVKPASPALLRGRVLSPGSSPALASISPAITPPLATPARPRSRPHSPAVNPSMRQQSRADASSYAPSTENVAKTNTANKRLRKDEDESSSDIPVAKRPRNSVTNGFDEDSKDSFSSVLSNDCTPKFMSGSSEGSKSRRIAANAHTLSKIRSVVCESSVVTNTPDALRQKMPVIPMATKGSKVKTTSQIVAELAERKGDSKLAERASKLEEQQVRDLPGSGSTTGMGRTTDLAVVSRNKMDHLHRFLSSQAGPAFEDYAGAGDDDRGSMSSETEGRGVSAPVSPPNVPSEAPPAVVMTPSNLDLLGVREDETAEEILARLQPIDRSSIVWDDPEDQTDTQEQEKEASGSDDSESEDEIEKLVQLSKQVPPDEVNRLHSTNLDCQNGNFDMDGKFREWHEVINKKGYQDDPLIVLPYVITDF